MNEGIHLDIDTWIIIIIIEGLSLLQSIPPTTADKQTQAQKRKAFTWIGPGKCLYSLIYTHIGTLLKGEMARKMAAVK